MCVCGQRVSGRASGQVRTVSLFVGIVGGFAARVSRTRSVVSSSLTEFSPCDSLLTSHLH